MGDLVLFISIVLVLIYGDHWRNCFRTVRADRNVGNLRDFVISIQLLALVTSAFVRTLLMKIIGPEAAYSVVVFVLYGIALTGAVTVFATWRLDRETPWRT